MTALEDLRSAQARIEGAELGGHGGSKAAIEGLKNAIRDALAPPGPSGDPAAARAQAQASLKAADHYSRAAGDIRYVSDSHLPRTWKGRAAELAARSISTLGTEVRRLSHPLEKAAEELTHWAEDLAWSQSRDQAGAARLHDALSLLDQDGQHAAAKKLAADGADARVIAAQFAGDRAREINTALRNLTGETRADRIVSPGRALIRAQIAALRQERGTLLTRTQVDRAVARLESMPGASQATLEHMLAGAKSPLQADYLWQALGAGHSMSTLESFNAAIAPHGADQAWLTEHLTPDLATDRYKGSSFDQGNHNDCVSASTIIAQAKEDPVLMMHLTTGGSAHGDDSGAAFHDRLQKLYLSQYVEGQKLDHDRHPSVMSGEGLGTVAETHLANQDLGAVTGTQYHHQSVAGNSERAGVLGPIKHAVASGKPVLINVDDQHNPVFDQHHRPQVFGHQMVVIGQKGDQLQVYSPWGVTKWVTDKQFVDGQLGAMTDQSVKGGYPGGLPTPFAVELPK